MKNNVTNWIIRIILGLILVVSLYLVISGLFENDVIDNKEVLEQSLNVNPTSMNIKVGEEKQIIAYVLPENATYTNLTWESTNSSIATVNNGIVQGISPGTTIVKVTTEKVKITRVINVVVEKDEVLVEKINVSNKDLELYIGDKVKIDYTLEPTDATNTNISFSTSDPNVVSFDSEGMLVAVNTGNAIVTLKSTNNIQDQVYVTVKTKDVVEEGVTLNKTKLTLDVGDSETLKATITPANATNKTLTWTSSNPSVATVESGKVVAKSNGTTTIKVKTNNGKEANCEVTVQKKLSRIHFIKQSIATNEASDAILLESNGHFGMVDTGFPTEKDNKYVYDYLKSVGVKELEFILITHCHDDHVGGVVYLLNSDIKVKRFYIKTYLGRDSKRGENTKYYKEITATLKKKNIPVTYIEKHFKDGQGFTLGDMDIKLYNTTQVMNQKGFSGGNENYNSVMQLITINKHKVFLTGDSYSGTIMQKIVNTIGKVDVMKLPHHGYGACSMDSKKANQLSPKYIIVTNAKITACRKHFNSNIPTYYTKASSKKAIVVDLTDKNIKISA